MTTPEPAPGPSEPTDPVPGTAGYGGEAAARLVEQYESVGLADVHPHLLPLLPDSGARVLDIGSGSGRDAAALTERGHRVVAVEPTAELRALARARHPDRPGRPPVTWVDDALPALPALRERGETDFDLVLVTAVWMHLAPAERALALPVVAGLLAPGGLLSLTVRHGPVPTGRHMFEVPDEEVRTAAAELGLTPVHLGSRGDLHGRDGVHWSELVFRAQP
ncbi:class I SAM-dependent methyltransferase (plasmid) [Streptomyces sp. BI20]|uniref:class I SAM-dependent methyltransferase n=1 Tax=Streptomyces sp. BI20 TaxID=3403460 RepID=UPI003C7189CE